MHLFESSLFVLFVCLDAHTDYIIGMDDSNSAAILRASEYWVGNSSGKQALPEIEQVGVHPCISGSRERVQQ